MLNFALVIALLFCITPYKALECNLYVSATSGNDNNPGTREQPLYSIKTLTTQLCNMKDTCVSLQGVLLPGDYTVSSTIQISCDIILLGQIDNPPTISFSTTGFILSPNSSLSISKLLLYGGRGFMITGKGKVNMSNVKIDPSKNDSSADQYVISSTNTVLSLDNITSRIGHLLTTTSSNVTISNCYFTNSSSNFISVFKGHLELTNSTIADPLPQSFNPIVEVEEKSAIISNCTFRRINGSAFTARVKQDNFTVTFKDCSFDGVYRAIETGKRGPDTNNRITLIIAGTSLFKLSAQRHGFDLMNLALTNLELRSANATFIGGRVTSPNSLSITNSTVTVFGTTITTAYVHSISESTLSHAIVLSNSNELAKATAFHNSSLIASSFVLNQRYTSMSNVMFRSCSIQVTNANYYSYKVIFINSTLFFINSKALVSLNQSNFICSKLQFQQKENPNAKGQILVSNSRFQSTITTVLSASVSSHFEKVTAIGSTFTLMYSTFVTYSTLTNSTISKTQQSRGTFCCKNNFIVDSSVSIKSKGASDSMLIKNTTITTTTIEGVGLNTITIIDSAFVTGTTSVDTNYLLIVNSSFTDNYAPKHSTIIVLAQNVMVNISSCTFRNNVGKGINGVLLVPVNPKSITCKQNNLFTYNKEQSKVEITNCTFINNTQISTSLVLQQTSYTVGNITLEFSSTPFCNFTQSNILLEAGSVAVVDNNNRRPIEANGAKLLSNIGLYTKAGETHSVESFVGVEPGEKSDFNLECGITDQNRTSSMLQNRVVVHCGNTTGIILVRTYDAYGNAQNRYQDNIEATVELASNGSYQLATTIDNINFGNFKIYFIAEVAGNYVATITVNSVVDRTTFYIYGPSNYSLINKDNNKAGNVSIYVDFVDQQQRTIEQCTEYLICANLQVDEHNILSTKSCVNTAMKFNLFLPKSATYNVTVTFKNQQVATAPIIIVPNQSSPNTTEVTGLIFATHADIRNREPYKFNIIVLDMYNNFCTCDSQYIPTASFVGPITITPPLSCSGNGNFSGSIAFDIIGTFQVKFFTHEKNEILATKGTSIVVHEKEKQCSPGSYKTKDSSCYLCPVGYYSTKSNQNTCTTCPNCTTTISAGSTSIHECVCKIGCYQDYSLQIPKCVVCTSHATTQAVNSSSEAQCYCTNNYYDTSNTSEHVKCSTCPSFNKNSNCKGNGNCAEGYAGYMCLACAESYTLFYSKCVSCISFLSIPYGIISTVTFILIVGIKSRLPRSLFMQVFRLVGAYARTVAIFVGLHVPWSTAVLFIYWFLAIVNFNVRFLFPLCKANGEATFYIGTIIKLCLPLLGFIVVIIILLIIKIKDKCSKKKKQVYSDDPSLQQSPSLWLLLLKYMIPILSWTYIVVSSSSLEIFNCFQRGDGKSVLEHSPLVVCYDSNWFFYYLPLGLIGIVIYVIGIPLLFTILLFKNKRKLDDPKVSFIIGFLYADYKLNRFYWILISKLQEILVILCIVFINITAIQITALSVLIIIEMILEIALRPHTINVINWISFSLTWLKYLFISAASILLYDQSDTSSWIAFGLIAFAVLVPILILLVLAIISLIRNSKSELQMQKPVQLQDLVINEAK